MQECGTICPTITATETGVRKIDKITNKENHIIDSPVVDKNAVSHQKINAERMLETYGFFR